MSPRIVDISNLQSFQAINLLSDPGHIAGPVVIPGVTSVILQWQLGSGKVGQNVLHARYSGGFPGSVSLANALFNGLTATGWANFIRHIATTASFKAVVFRDLAVANQPLISSTNTAVVGTDATTELPNETAIAVTLRTARTGQAFRGRAYLPGFASASVAAGNVILAQTVTDVQAWANAWPGAFSAQGLTLCIAQPARAAYTSPATGRQFPARAAGSVDVSSLVVRDNHWDSQRRRGLK